MNLIAVLALLSQPAAEVATLRTLPKKPSIRYSECRCPNRDEPFFAILKGIVIDAEVTLSADGLSPADRQATIFNVTSTTRDVKGRTRIWHRTNIAKCGVNFDYGKKYLVVVRRTDQGFETDECLMRRIRAHQ